MDLIGVLAEYNPLHKGHIYHLNTIKDHYPEAKILVLMVGHFTQRGEPTILSKWDRTSLALKAGADLVFEFPFCGATSPAQGYGRLALDIFNTLGVQGLSFGCHERDPRVLLDLAEKILDFKRSKSMARLKDTSLPKLLMNSLDLSPKERDLLNHGNDVLALEYCQRILEKKYPIDIFPVLRLTKASCAKSPYLSASSIREKVHQGQVAGIKESLPIDSYNLLKDVHYTYEAQLRDFYTYAFHFSKNRALIEKQIHSFIYKEWIHHKKPLKQVSSKNFTNASIRREILSLVFSYNDWDRQKDLALGKEYLRLLGAKKEALFLLRTRPAIGKFTKGLESPLCPIFETSLKATRLRNLLLGENTALDYTVSPLIID